MGLSGAAAGVFFRRRFLTDKPQHRRHKVPVGEWSLVHLADPATCHCVLSRLDESTDLPAVIAAIAPCADFSAPHDHHHSHKMP
jgi:hypothetical protein